MIINRRKEEEKRMLKIVDHSLSAKTALQTRRTIVVLNFSRTL